MDMYITADAWQTVPLLRKEGIFHGSAVGIGRMRRAPGAHLFVCPDKVQISSENKNPQTSTADSGDKDVLARLLAVFEKAMPDNPEAARKMALTAARLVEDLKPEVLPANTVRIPVFFQDWKYTDDNGDTEEMDIEALIMKIRPGHQITFRMSRNWRKKAYYCRYVKDETLDLWSGYAEESDWRQLLHPYPQFDRAGTFDLVILNCDFVTDDFNQGSFSLEVREIKPSTPVRYRLTVPQGTQAFRFLQGLPSEEICNHVFNIHTERDHETGRSFAVQISLADRRRGFSAHRSKYARTKNLSSVSTPGYAAMKTRAEIYAPLPCTELDDGQAFYKKLTGVVYDDLYSDFLVPGFCFLPVLLEDGRIICPELRSRTKKTRDALRIASCLGLKNQLTERRSLFPGVKVTLYFTPAQHKRHLMLRVLTIDTDDAELEILQMEYLRKVLIRNHLLPETEETVKIHRMDAEERKKYIEMLEERRTLL